MWCRSRVRSSCCRRRRPRPRWRGTRSGNRQILIDRRRAYPHLVIRVEEEGVRLNVAVDREALVRSKNNIASEPLELRSRPPRYFEIRCPGSLSVSDAQLIHVKKPRRIANGVGAENARSREVVSPVHICLKYPAIVAGVGVVPHQVKLGSA